MQLLGFRNLGNEFMAKLISVSIKTNSICIVLTCSVVMLLSTVSKVARWVDP